MKNIKLILGLTTLTLLLLGCGDFEPNVNFEETIKGRTINLSNKVGDLFQVLRGDDTITYSLTFDKKVDLNYIVKSDFDTVFVGTVTKRNELFLLNRPLENGKFTIHALKFTDSTVTGLETEWIQSNIIKNEIDSGKFTDLTADTAGIITIKAKKKDGKEIFRFVIEQLEAEKLVVPEPEYLTGNYEANSLIVKSDVKISSKTGLINKVYPNPFIDNITIKLTEKAPYIFIINDLNGKNIKTLKLNTDNIKIDLPNLKSGLYILNIFSHTSELIYKIKLVKR